ncbi:MAG TPA: glycoside hydrolase [bacterium]|nr:glycoside hydrolase [bacterium]
MASSKARRFFARPFPQGRRFLVFLVFLAIPSPNQAGLIQTCDGNRSVTVGAYVVGTNYWNPGVCDGRQCLTIDDRTGSFTVDSDNFACAPEVASYPFIFYGSHFGSVSPGSALPLPVSQLASVTSDWAFKPSKSGSWDAAYDVWFSRGLSTAQGFKGGAELMIWLDYQGDVPPAGTRVGPVTLGGKSWTLWEGNIGWNYIAYLADQPVTAVKALDILAFTRDAAARGYLSPDWYLAAVEAGNELRTGGTPFTSLSYSVSLKALPAP